MDGFGDNFVPNGNGEAVDPAAEFLAREQEELSGLEDPSVVNESQEEQDNQTNFDHFPSEVNGTVENNEMVTPQDNTAAAASQTPERVITPVPRIDPEAIRIWRENHQEKLIEKDASEEKAKGALKVKAKQELADWYKQHEEQVAKTRQANRCAEKELVADTERPEPGTEWERIAKLCDFNPKTAKSSRDVSRMRSIILHVKQSPPTKA